jgi:hypothetical protein
MAFLTCVVSLGLLFEVSALETTNRSQNHIKLQSKNSQPANLFVVDEMTSDPETQDFDRTDILSDHARQPLESTRMSHRGSGRNCSGFGC